MQMPVQITMKNVDHSKSVEDRIRQKVFKLNQFSEDIVSCRVVVEQNQAHKHHGAHYNVRLNVNMPGRELVVNHNEQENLYIAIREAFENMNRRVKEVSQVMHGRVKHQDLLKKDILLGGLAVEESPQLQEEGVEE